MRKSDYYVYILAAFAAGIFLGMILSYAYASLQAEHKKTCSAHYYEL